MGRLLYVVFDDSNSSLMMEAARTSETSVYCNETTRLYITERSHLHKYVNPINVFSDYCLFFVTGIYIFLIAVFSFNVVINVLLIIGAKKVRCLL
jgi:hypothetical protein